MTGDVIELKLPPQAQYLALLRLFFEGLARQLGFPPLEVEKIVMAVDEALANSVRYHDAWPSGVENFYTVRISVEPDTLRISVEDPGDDFGEAFGENVDLDAHLEEMRSSGLGLYIIKNFMDDVYYERRSDQRNELHMIKRLIVNNPYIEESPTPAAS